MGYFWYSRLESLDKFGNDTGKADTTLNRANTGQVDLQLLMLPPIEKAILGTMTLSSIKNFAVAGDKAAAKQGYFELKTLILVKPLQLVQQN